MASDSLIEDENNLYLAQDGDIHLVDTIVQFKKTKLGQPYFRLTMYCPCCKHRQFWCSLQKLE
jgi:hypothetical protein